jgi:4-amino-4-deoxy-L-arabinose transferase-like glycosyltransferase
MLAAAAVLLLIAPIRKGDLAGYDDALYAHLARGIVESGDWLNIQSNGAPSLEHPPGLPWMQAALFLAFGLSDTAAKLPAAVLGVATVLLVYWLARRLLGDARAAVAAMFVMLATPYFIKYTSHAMTDVPMTFFFTASVCAWVAAKDRPVWYLPMAAAAACALFMRSVVGFAVPGTLGILSLIDRRPLRYVLPALAAACAPIAAWYGYLIATHGDHFFEVQSAFLRSGISAQTGGTWRRYTGAFEYAWMLAKSYWPWLPFTVWGLIVSIRERDRRVLPLVVWAGIMFAVCAAGGGRVLRYLLPAYPAFSILASIGLMRIIPERALVGGLRWIPPAAVAAAAGIAAFPPVNLHAEETRAIAAAAARITPRAERMAFYDEGQPRWDETGQVQWYGYRTMWLLMDREQLPLEIAKPLARVWIVDQATYEQYFAPRDDVEIVLRSGHLVLLRLSSARQATGSPSHPWSDRSTM